MSAYSTTAGSARRHGPWLRLTRGPDGASMSPGACARWLVLLMVAVVDFTWMRFAGFQIGPGLPQVISTVLLLGVISLFFFYTGGDKRLMEFAHFGAQYLSLFAIIIPLGYLTASRNAPLVDPTFDAIDRAMGLHWLAWTEWVEAHPMSRWGLHIAYVSLPVQVLFGYWYNAHKRAPWKNDEIWWITFSSAVVTLMISALAPAISAWVYYGLANMHDFRHMQHFEAVRAGTLRVIGFSDAEGLVQLPSFHTIVAIMATYNLRHDRWLFLPAVALNTVLILSCPTEGGHYFVDIAAGGAVAAATIWGVRAARRRFEPAPPRRDVIARG